MKHRVEAECYSDTIRSNITFEIETPNVCPCCNIAWQPYILKTIYTDTKWSDVYNYAVDVIWFCPNCKNPSISRYYCISTPRTSLQYSFPKNALCSDFYKGIEELSPSFVKIYKEAFNAESKGLHEVAGVGYRKALEFLVKDYAIRVAPNEKDDIEETALAKCVTKYIANPKIAQIVERTVWLGNDQTHYKKKHVGKGIEDLKILLDLSVNYITMELQAEEAMKITKK